MRSAGSIAGTLLALASTATASIITTSQPIWMTVLPTAPPTDAPEDPWQCATEDISQHFDVPKPTGAVSSALASHGRQLRSEVCTLTGADELDCPFPDKARWCAITTALPASLAPAYLAYGSVASSWWAAHSAEAVVLAQDCPVGWYAAMMMTPNGPNWLNSTIIMAECHADAKITAGAGSGTGLTAAPTATPGSGVTTTLTAVQTTTGTNGVRRRAEAAEAWAAIGGGLVAAANCDW